MLNERYLKTGSTVGVSAPASFGDPAALDRGVRQLEAFGYKVSLGEYCRNRWYSFAGTDKERGDDLNRLFSDRKIDAIFAMRGGYGSIRLLDRIDYDRLREHPKPFVGFSDVTSLHIALVQKAGLVTYHGPMVISTLSDHFDDFTRESMRQALCSDAAYDLVNPVPLRAVCSGKASGEIIGGNLAVLVSTLGTDYEIDTRGKLIFLEDVNEPTYKIDRMLTQLRQCGKFSDAVGVLLGSFTDCNKAKACDFTLDELWEAHFQDLGKPVIANLQSGHCHPFVTLPFGVPVEVDADQQKLRVVR